jgi:hypothetical protein
LWLLLLALVVASPLASAETQEPVAGNRSRIPFPVPRTTETLTLDGAIAEMLWEHALMLPLRYEVQPGENIDPPVRTEMLLAYDDLNLYVAFRAHDDNPSAIRARFTDRDSMFDDDFVGIVLDTFNDERRAFEFFANPLGVQADMLMDDVSGNEDSNWNAIWESAGRSASSRLQASRRGGSTASGATRASTAITSHCSRATAARTPTSGRKKRSPAFRVSGRCRTSSSCPL